MFNKVFSSELNIDIPTPWHQDTSWLILWACLGAKSYEAFETWRGNSSFGWNEEDKVVTAPEEIWAEYIKASRVHPEVRQFKNNTLKFYSEIREVFDNAVATSELATATGMRTQKRENSVYTIESSSSDDTDVEVASPNSFSLASTDPPNPIFQWPQAKIPLPIEHSPSHSI
ncbi:hypothetical protein B9Z19DRAFT_1126118 [Tuber borchii]|uniref:Uncharacterized protein n=1 Tax=Tuber borchii TaxID=42251 RepID=A0A2T6ZTD7_TUBBO|nr:hypothetical protein B9Z19DRAFT_1126118 [Tuber borchii]